VRESASLHEGVIPKLHGHRWGAVGEAICKIVVRRWIKQEGTRFNICICAPNYHVH
jgi:hypothetical protein